MTVRCGDTLPQLGDRCDGLYLTQIEIDCSELTADLHFGAPEFLSVDDMASLLSNFRNKRRTTLATSRVEGKPDDGAAEVEMGLIPPLSSTEFAPGVKAKTTIKSSDGSTGSINLDASALKSGETISQRELSVSSSSLPATKVKILASENLNMHIKPIASGSGIAVTEKDGAIVISATGGGGSLDGGGSTGGGEDSGTGISGTLVFATVPHYDEAVHQLLYTPVSLTFANGRLTAMETGDETVIAQAVEESV